MLMNIPNFNGTELVCNGIAGCILLPIVGWCGVSSPNSRYDTIGDEFSTSLPLNSETQIVVNPFEKFDRTKRAHSATLYY